jgi:transcriptional repressor NrdR
VRRRRQCKECGRRFTTYETFRLELRVEKRSGASEDFDRGKILRVIEKLTWDRHVGRKTCEDLVRGLEAELSDSGEPVVASAALAQKLYARLVELDTVAAQRFASNYVTEDGTVRIARDPSPQLTLPVMAAPAEPTPPRAPRKRKP